MPEFRFTAIDAAGAVTQGRMDASDASAVIASLQRAGSIPVRAEPVGTRRWLDIAGRDLGRSPALSRTELTDVTRELSIMLAAGQDLDRALRFLTETGSNRRAVAVLGRVRDAVRDGSPLAAALERQPASFFPLYIGMVRAGEAGGALAATLDRLAALLERERSLRSAIRSALIYPAMLVVAAIGSITLLLTQVLPQFTPLFQQNGVALPTSTQLLIALGAAVSVWGPYLLLLAMAAGLAWRPAMRRPGARLAVDRAMLRLPVVGGLMREVVAARFTRTLGTLLVNGVPLITALRIVRDAVGNAAAAAAIDAAGVNARGGAGLAGPLAQTGVMPARTIHLLSLGEETGRLGAMALNAADIHEEKTRIAIQRLMALLVPVITIVMGAAIAGIVVSLLLAMLSLNNLAQ